MFLNSTRQRRGGGARVLSNAVCFFSAPYERLDRKDTNANINYNNDKGIVGERATRGISLRPPVPDWSFLPHGLQRNVKTRTSEFSSLLNQQAKASRSHPSSVGKKVFGRCKTDTRAPARVFLAPEPASESISLTSVVTKRTSFFSVVKKEARVSRS